MLATPLVSRIINTTTALANQPSINTYRSQSEYMRPPKLITEMAQFCANFPQENRWLEVLSSAATLARLDPNNWSRIPLACTAIRTPLIASIILYTRQKTWSVDPKLASLMGQYEVWSRLSLVVLKNLQNFKWMYLHTGLDLAKIPSWTDLMS
jgi:hypothetical protein